MDRRRRTLILDTDPDALITLQHVLEQADVDATVTWDEMEAIRLIETAPFDLLLIGDHPPEINAAAILDDLSLRGTCPPVLILRGLSGEKTPNTSVDSVQSAWLQSGIPTRFLSTSQRH